MNVTRLLPVLLLAAMTPPAFAQDDSGLWTMLLQLESLSDPLLAGQDALTGGAVPGESQMRSSPESPQGAGPSPKAIVAGMFGTHAGLGLRAAVGATDGTSAAQKLDTGRVRLP